MKRKFLLLILGLMLISSPVMSKDEDKNIESHPIMCYNILRGTGYEKIAITQLLWTMQ